MHLPKAAPWLAAYETELMLFPVGSHDDQVDSTAYALAYWQESLQVPAILQYLRGEAERLGLRPVPSPPVPTIPHRNSEGGDDWQSPGT